MAVGLKTKNQHDVTADAENVVDRKDIQADILKAVCTEHVVNDISMGKHDSFSVTCGTGCEDDHGTVGWFRTGFYVFSTVGFVDLWDGPDIFYAL